MRVFFAAGPGDVINAHKKWLSGEVDPTQMALTYSSQFADFCKNIGATAHIVGSSHKMGRFSDSEFLIEHCPKRKIGFGSIGYHLSEILYGLTLFRKARTSKCNIAVIHSGSTHPFVLWIFRFSGIKVIPVLHNTIWPAGHPEAGIVRRAIRKLDAYFFRHGAYAAIGVSPECIRQVKAVTGENSRIKLIDIRGQFTREYFDSLPGPPTFSIPFKIMYAGRMVSSKGVYDVLKAANAIEQELPGLINWEICGDGPELESMLKWRTGLNIGHIVQIHGHVLPDGMREIISRNHAAIVPTRSDFSEGMALSAVEPVLTNRPVITNSVVPALEVLRPACVEAKTDDYKSYVERIIELANSPEMYEKLCVACDGLKAPFYNREFGFAKALKEAIS
jgi:glycogen synthase